MEKERTAGGGVGSRRVLVQKPVVLSAKQREILRCVYASTGNGGDVMGMQPTPVLTAGTVDVAKHALRVVTRDHRVSYLSGGRGPARLRAFIP